MKDLELKDIMARQDRPLTRISVYFSGRWSYANPNTPSRKTVDQNFYLISYPFLLHRSGLTDPSKGLLQGAPGDYMAQDMQGVMSLVKASQYALLFPSTQHPTIKPTSSENLRNPNFLTKIQLESVDKDSDKVLIGSKTFSLPTTQKKTITIIETPNGQSQVYSNTPYGVVYDYTTSTMVEALIPTKPTSNY